MKKARADLIRQIKKVQAQVSKLNALCLGTLEAPNPNIDTSDYSREQLDNYNVVTRELYSAIGQIKSGSDAMNTYIDASLKSLECLNVVPDVKASHHTIIVYLKDHTDIIKYTAAKQISTKELFLKASEKFRDDGMLDKGKLELKRYIGPQVAQKAIGMSITEAEYKIINDIAVVVKCSYKKAASILFNYYMQND